MTVAPLDVFREPLDGVRLIEASAGTGKTWAICGLYLRLLLERGWSTAQILVVTFTNAATAELRERIRSRIVQTATRLDPDRSCEPDLFVDGLLAALRAQGLDDAVLRARLQQALQAFDEAAIFTIHGFCQRALADAPFAAGLPLRQDLLADDSVLREAVVRDHWRRHVTAPDADPMLAAALQLQGDTPERWDEWLRQALARPLARTRWPEAGASPAPSEAMAVLADRHARARAAWVRDAQALAALIRGERSRLKANIYSDKAIDAALGQWTAWMAANDPLDPAREGSHLHLLHPRKLDESKRKDQVPPSHPLLALAGELLDARDAALAALRQRRLDALRRFLHEAPEALRADKRARRVVAFDDMLFNLHARLSDPATGDALAALLRQRYPAALIDEFQDTDPLQFAIFERLQGRSDAPLILVGDPKQAIYGFRNADLHTYLAARRQAGAVRTLVENQRAVPALITALNALFTRHPRAFVLDGLDYQPVRAGARARSVLADATGPAAALRVWLLPDADGEVLTKTAALARATAACADEIARLIAAGRSGAVTLAGRALAGGDIAVLVRSHAQGARMRAALAARGIASVELSQASVHHSAEAEELERVLEAMLEPGRDERLRAALATELLGLDAAALLAAREDPARWDVRVADLADDLGRWRSHGVGVMLRHWMRREGVTERLLARPDGERRLTNLLHLIERLQEAEPDHPAPDALLRWLQACRRETRADEAAQLRLESDRHLVQIVTIHKSKGLEYPFVFCPFLWDGRAPGDRRPDAALQYHDDAGRPVLDYRPAPEPDDAERAQLEDAAETVRLVYVALTRAVHRCHLVAGPYSSRGTLKECGKAWLNWLVAGGEGTALDWLRQGTTAPALTAAWRSLATAATEGLAVEPLPAGPGGGVSLAVDAAGSIEALAPPARIPPAWWIASYSSLSHGTRHEAAAVDHDTRSATAEAARVPVLSNPPGDNPDRGADDTRAVPALAPDDLLGFPRGPVAGECLHAVFEHADFQDPSTWDRAIRQALARHPQRVAPADEALLPRMLRRTLDDVLATDLAPALAAQGLATAPLRLSELPTGRRLNELEFILPARGVDIGALATLLRQAGYPVPALSVRSLEGYLRGFIDLVFEHDGRYHLIDWKSNHLGGRPQDYEQPALARAMDEQGYHLQVLLYTVALDRHLQRRLPGYRRDEHLGGVFYLFVRGVRPQWRQADGRPCGVFAARPPHALIQHLSALLAGPGGGHP